MWRALCLTFNEEVAVKLLDLENVNCSLVSPSSQQTATISHWLMGDLAVLN